jgi:hypothetical protein
MTVPNKVWLVFAADPPFHEINIAPTVAYLSLEDVKSACEMAPKVNGIATHWYVSAGRTLILSNLDEDLIYFEIAEYESVLMDEVLHD